MGYPPEGCSYRVDYPSGSETLSASFADEFELGAWFREREAAGELDRTSDELSVHCVTDEGEQGIDVMHPRLVRGRIETPPA